MSRLVSYKSFCWAVGTTSYRTDNFNSNIEQQLDLMDKFRNLPENGEKRWVANNTFQEEYYHFLKANDFLEGEAKRPDKDAREKTSGLVDIGLLDADRNLTEAGKVLLKIARKQNFEADNFLEIQKDSYIYFKQLLKTYNEIDDKTVRPFVVFLYVVNQVGYLSNEEFTYLLPLCVDEDTTALVVDRIKQAHESGALVYEDVIISVLMKMDNYKIALDILQSRPVTEELLCEVGINRKSVQYDKPYFKIYKLLKQIVFDKEELALELYEATKGLKNSKVGGSWRKCLFSSNSRSVISREGNDVLNKASILESRTVKEFNESFFKMMHLYKATATLSDYSDLNRRYFKATDVVIFEDRQVKLDVLPKCYISMIGAKLLDVAFKKTELLAANVELEEINKCFAVDIDSLYKQLGKTLGRAVQDKESARLLIKSERYERLNKLIDDKFNKETLIELLTNFEERDDDELRKKITDNADVPTMFEYILGISWYIISDRKGDVLDYMNLSLEADLLPKTHAGGGEADIVWDYTETDMYPAHTLLIEATLADRTSQRRMEMEPVSRHLGDYLLKNPGKEAYCVFITTFLNTNVISDFRGRRFMEYYNSAEDEYITGMKILPLQTTELKTLLKFDVKYPQIYKMFDKAYMAEGRAKEWYENSIVKEATLMYKV